VHHEIVGDVAIREDHVVHLLLADEAVEHAFGTMGIPRGTGGRQARRGSGDGRCADLRCGEGDDAYVWVIAKDHIEVVEVATAAPMMTTRFCATAALLWSCFRTCSTESISTTQKWPGSFRWEGAPR